MFDWVSEVVSRLFDRESLIKRITDTRGGEVDLTPIEICMVDQRAGVMIDYKCGHFDSERFALNLYGEIFPATDAHCKRRELCGECSLAEALRYSIRCAACGFAILPKHPVTLYSDNDRFEKEWKTVFDIEGEKCVFGCLRSDCCPSGGFFAGHWMGDHFKPFKFEVR